MSSLLLVHVNWRKLIVKCLLSPSSISSTCIHSEISRPEGRFSVFYRAGTLSVDLCRRWFDILSCRRATVWCKLALIWRSAVFWPGFNQGHAGRRLSIVINNAPAAVITNISMRRRAAHVMHECVSVQENTDQETLDRETPDCDSHCPEKNLWEGTDDDGHAPSCGRSSLWIHHSAEGYWCSDDLYCIKTLFFNKCLKMSKSWILMLNVNFNNQNQNVNYKSKWDKLLIYI